MDSKCGVFKTETAGQLTLWDGCAIFYNTLCGTNSFFFDSLTSQNIYSHGNLINPDSSQLTKSTILITRIRQATNPTRLSYTKITKNFDPLMSTAQLMQSNYFQDLNIAKDSLGILTDTNEIFIPWAIITSAAPISGLHFGFSWGSFRNPPNVGQYTWRNNGIPTMRIRDPNSQTMKSVDCWGDIALGPDLSLARNCSLLRQNGKCSYDCALPSLKLYTSMLANGRILNQNTYQSSNSVQFRIRSHNLYLNNFKYNNH